MGRIAFLAAEFVAYVVLMFTRASSPQRTLQETVDAANSGDQLADHHPRFGGQLSGTSMVFTTIWYISASNFHVAIAHTVKSE